MTTSELRKELQRLEAEDHGNADVHAWVDGGPVVEVTIVAGIDGSGLGDLLCRAEIVYLR